jgi:uncharacterized coiled-coil DUF342 family protein
MFSNHQDFVEELQGKEEEMSKVIKMADNFKEEAQVLHFAMKFLIATNLIATNFCCLYL